MRDRTSGWQDGVVDTGAPQYFPAIDGLRAVAVIAVMFFHGGHLSGGFLGVDVFFVISGYLITGLLLREAARGSGIRLGEFWARRARRLLPALSVMLLAVTLWTVVVVSTAERLALRSDSLWGMSFLMNWHEIFASHDYWSSFALQSPLTHLWSLAVEEQFYLVWPIVVVFIVLRSRRPERSVLSACVVGAALSFGAMAILYDPTSTTRVYEGTDTRIGALLVGGLCATAPVRTYVAHLIGSRTRRVLLLTNTSLIVSAAGIGWMLAATHGADASMFSGLLLAFSIATGVVICLITTAGGSEADRSLVAVAAARRCLSLRPLRWVGGLSYGLYLWHWPVFLALSPARTGLADWPLLLLRFGVTTVIAVVSHRLVETPARIGLQRRPAWVTAPAVGLAVAVAALVTVSVTLPRDRVAALNLNIFATSTISEPSTTVAGSLDSPSTTSDAVSPTAIATTTVPAVLRGRIRTVLLLGDSIAMTTAPGIVAAFEAAGLDVVSGSQPGVGLANRTAVSEFDRIAQLVAYSRPELIIVQLSAWDAEFGEAQQYETLTQLHTIGAATGAQMAIMPIPPLRKDQDLADYASLSAAAQRLAAEFASDVMFLDSNVVWGSEYHADLNADHVPERMYDGVHLCASGAALVGAWLVDQIATRFAGVEPAPVATWAGAAWSQIDIYDTPPGACAAV